ncbi:MAG TPA: metallophosphoesterase [Thermoanaerobaculia bacterium]|nr:metallophosphoesterase [Thermoanaerobaculia bacterium]
MSVARPAIAISAILLSALSLPGLSLRRGPVIGRPDDESVAVTWITDAPSDSRVDYGPAAGDWSTVRSEEAVTRHRIVLGGLIPGAVYRYRILSGDVALAEESTFRAPRGSTDTAFRFAVMGDTDGTSVPTRIADRLAESDVDLAIHTGDVVYPAGAEQDYDAQFFTPMARWLRRGPVLPALGNHDAMTDGGAPLLSDFVLPKNDATHDSRFYSFRQGNALFLCLDVETSAFGAGSPQYQWLERVLSETSSSWKFIYFHTPAYSSAHSNRVVRLVLSPLFERYGVDVVFAGHEHLYERTFAIRDFVSSGRGVVYVTEGGGGANLTSFRPEEYSAYVADRYGFVEVEVAEQRLTLLARDPTGVVFDSLVIDKSVGSGERMPLLLRSRGRPEVPHGRE